MGVLDWILSGVPILSSSLSSKEYDLSSLATCFSGRLQIGEFAFLLLFDGESSSSKKWEKTPQNIHYVIRTYLIIYKIIINSTKIIQSDTETYEKPK